MLSKILYSYKLSIISYFLIGISMYFNYQNIYSTEEILLIGLFITIGLIPLYLNEIYKYGDYYGKN